MDRRSRMHTWFGSYIATVVYMDMHFCKHIIYSGRVQVLIHCVYKDNFSCNHSLPSSILIGWMKILVWPHMHGHQPMHGQQPMPLLFEQCVEAQGVTHTVLFWNPLGEDYDLIKSVKDKHCPPLATPFQIMASRLKTKKTKLLLAWLVDKVKMICMVIHRFKCKIHSTLTFTRNEWMHSWVIVKVLPHTDLTAYHWQYDWWQAWSI